MSTQQHRFVLIGGGSGGYETALVAAAASVFSIAEAARRLHTVAHD